MSTNIISTGTELYAFGGHINYALSNVYGSQGLIYLTYFGFWPQTHVLYVGRDKNAWNRAYA